MSSCLVSSVNAPDGLNAACLGCFCRDNLNTDCSNAVWSELNDHYGDDVYGFDYDYWHATQDPTATAATGGTNCKYCLVVQFMCPGSRSRCNNDSFVAVTMNYADCRRDLDCATQTVVKYLTMHTKKCLDAALEKPGCLDYAIIQFNGVMGCTVPAPQKGRWNQLNDCLAAN